MFILRIKNLPNAIGNKLPSKAKSQPSDGESDNTVRKVKSLDSRVVFKNFKHEYNFKWNSSSPGYQQSNGMAESAVKVAKKIPYSLHY